MTAESLELTPPLFNVGDQVSPRSNPTKVGVVLEVQRQKNGNLEYRVFFGANQQDWYRESSLSATIPVDDTPKATDGSKFLKDMALIKLKSNLSDTLYSYRASRTVID